jgi:hypothetical protein
MVAFMGKSVDYWIELERLAETGDVVSAIENCVTLRRENQLLKGKLLNIVQEIEA